MPDETNYALRMEVIAERVTALKTVAQGHREDLDRPDADAVNEVSALINSIFEAYPNLCDEESDCDGRCNHALATLLAVAIHCLAESDFVRS